MRKLLAGLLVVTIAGCVNLRPPSTTIWEPRTETGRQFKAQYLNNFQSLVNDVRAVKGIGDIEGMLARGPGADSASFYFGVNVGTTASYNTLRTNFEERAATVVAENGFPILQAIGKQRDPVADARIKGAYVSIAWTAADFSEKYSSGDMEAVLMYIPKDVLADYLSFKMTNQELMNKSMVIGYKNGQSTGRIQLNVGKNL